MVFISSEYPLKNWWYFFLSLTEIDVYVLFPKTPFSLVSSWAFSVSSFNFHFLFWQIQNSNSRLLQNENMEIEFKWVNIMNISCGESHRSKRTCKFVVWCFFSSREKQKHSSFTQHLFFISFVVFNNIYWIKHEQKRNMFSKKKMFLFLFLFKKIFLCVYV